MSLPFALPAALAYGVADFAGGLAARRRPVLAVAAVMQAAGLVALVPALALVPGTASVAAFGVGALAGVAGATGLLLYLRGLAVGPMGLVAPLSAVVGAGLPLLIGMLGGERPGPVTWLAIAVALAAIVLATAGSRADAATGAGLALGLAAGVGFGLFFVGMDAAPADSGLIPLVAGRLVSVPLLLVPTLLRHRRAAAPSLLTVVGGLCDALANVLFLLAARAGELGVSAVVVSLYPIVVVLLAWVLLRERLTGAQLTSAGLAVGASVLLAAGQPALL
jgi:drug/metabolite transporter (DMT)-like permease